MPAGILYINGNDAYTQWGISLDTQSLSALMTPAPQKDALANASRNENGKQVEANNKVADRDLTLTLNLTASSESDFFTKYESFCVELATGVIDIRTAYQPTIEYHCLYLSCTAFTQFMQGIGKFSLKLNEFNPAVRTIKQRT